MSWLFHDIGDKYFYPLEPKSTDKISLRFESDEDLLSVFIERKFKDLQDTECFEMHFEQKTEIGNLYLWLGELPCTEKPFYYRFKVFYRNDSVSYYTVYGEKQENDFTGCFYVIPGFSTPEWSKGVYWYSIMPNAFYNGDVLNDKCGNIGDIPWNTGLIHPYASRYGGDIRGIIKKLDYIKDLGVDALYINPIWTCKDAGGYGPDNFEQIDPAYGDNADLIELSNELHKRNMKLMLDAVVDFSTTSSNLYNQYSEWPINGCYQTKDVKCYDYFRWDSWPLGFKKCFSSLEFNFQKDSVKDYIYRNSNSFLQRYIKEPYNIDAWRFDSSELLAGENLTAVDIAFDMKKHLKEINQDMLFLGENYADMKDGAWETCWNMHQLYNLREWAEKKYDLKFFLEKMRFSLNEMARPLALSMYTHFDNHDVSRIYPYVKDKSRLLTIIICNMTYLGSPTLFFGDETGEKNIGSGYIHSFNWNTDEWDFDFYCMYKVLSVLRKKYDVFKKGIVKVTHMDNTEELLIYGRVYKEQSVIVALNPNNEIKKLSVNFSIYGLKDGIELIDIISGEKYKIENGCALVSVNVGGSIFVQEKDDIIIFSDYRKTFSPNNIDFGISVPLLDWSYSENLSNLSEIIVGEDKSNCVFVKFSEENNIKCLSMGRIVDEEYIPYYEKDIQTSDVLVTIQKIGTRYSAYYKTSDCYELLGENIFASFSNVKLALYKEKIYFKPNENGFGNLIYGGISYNNSICKTEFDGNFDKYNKSLDILKLTPLLNNNSISYTYDGVKLDGINGCSNVIYSNCLKDYRVTATFKPLEYNGNFGIFFGADAQGTNGYKLCIDNTGNCSLYYKNEIIHKCKIVINEFAGVKITLEVLNNRIALFYGNNNKKICFIKDGINKQGYLGFYSEGMSCVLTTYQALDISQSINRQNYGWSFKKNIAEFNGTGTANIQGKSYSKATVNVNLSLKPVSEDNVGFSGLLLGASEGLLAKDDGIYICISTDGYFCLKNKDEIIKKVKINEFKECNNLKINFNNGKYNANLNDELFIDYENDAYISGVIALCSEKSISKFTDFKIQI